MMKAPLCSVLLLLLLSAATGCSRYYWSKPGATAEQFTQDNQACLRQAAATLPAGAALEAVEQYYRACLGSRGYVRDKQMDPPPPGSYRGIESGEEFNAAVQAAAAGQTPRQGFEQQLAQLDDLKARGRITEDEYATMRKRLVEGVTPGALTPAPAVAAPAAAATPPRSVAGRW
ncbi:MAG TPA: SHOCT domain-containing protein, partial [Methylomirabilota bacterium]|nr:SHOCT domain-containing protein [Methylomirabilota bacterium]